MSHPSRWTSGLSSDTQIISKTCTFSIHVTRCHIFTGLYGEFGSRCYFQICLPCPSKSLSKGVSVRAFESIPNVKALQITLKLASYSGPTLDLVWECLGGSAPARIYSLSINFDAGTSDMLSFLSAAFAEMELKVCTVSTSGRPLLSKGAVRPKLGLARSRTYQWRAKGNLSLGF